MVCVGCDKLQVRFFSATDDNRALAPNPDGTVSIRLVNLVDGAAGPRPLTPSTPWPPQLCTYDILNSESGVDRPQFAALWHQGFDVAGVI